MAEQIKPERITKPIQLLAAWLAGLVVIDGAFLTAASALHTPTWLPALLVIAAVANVPIFIGALFLLQTRFRPEMQEDTFYSQYLERRYSVTTSEVPKVDIAQSSRQLASEIIAALRPGDASQRQPLEELIRNSRIDELARKRSNNRSLSELYLRPELWPKVVKRYGNDPKLAEELAELRADELATVQPDAPQTVTLTELGRSVAKRQVDLKISFRDAKNEFWEAQGTELTKEDSSAS